jgi:hypothetical protein
MYLYARQCTVYEMSHRRRSALGPWLYSNYSAGVGFSHDCDDFYNGNKL